jgi:ParB family chromosome partitioning protein
MVREGRLTAGHARTLLSVEDPEKRALEIVEGALNVREAEQRSQKVRSGVNLPKLVDPNIADYESRISNALGLKVQITHKANESGEVRIQYKSLEQLEDVINRLSRAS